MSIYFNFPYSNNKRAIKLLRFFIWLTPTGILIALLAFYSLAGFITPQIAFWLLPFLLALLTFGAGMFDGLFANAVPKHESKPVLKELLDHAYSFLLLQIMIVPGLIIAFFGVSCAIDIL